MCVIRQWYPVPALIYDDGPQYSWLSMFMFVPSTNISIHAVIHDIVKLNDIFIHESFFQLTSQWRHQFIQNEICLVSCGTMLFITEHPPWVTYIWPSLRLLVFRIYRIYQLTILYLYRVCTWLLRHHTSGQRDYFGDEPVPANNQENNILRLLSLCEHDPPVITSWRYNVNRCYMQILSCVSRKEYQGIGIQMYI